MILLRKNNEGELRPMAITRKLGTYDLDFNLSNVAPVLKYQMPIYEHHSFQIQ